jgi:hypothetical protein
MAKHGLIPYDRMPIKWIWYVPKWAQDAVALYNKNNGYAGMDFEDFIKRMKPQEST